MGGSFRGVCHFRGGSLLMLCDNLDDAIYCDTYRVIVLK